MCLGLYSYIFCELTAVGAQNLSLRYKKQFYICGTRRFEPFTTMHQFYSITRTSIPNTSTSNVSSILPESQMPWCCVQACDYFVDEQRLEMMCGVLGRRLFCPPSEPPDTHNMDMVCSSRHAQLEPEPFHDSTPPHTTSMQPEQARIPKVFDTSEDSYSNRFCLCRAAGASCLCSGPHVRIIKRPRIVFFVARGIAAK